MTERLQWWKWPDGGAPYQRLITYAKILSLPLTPHRHSGWQWFIISLWVCAHSSMWICTHTHADWMCTWCTSLCIISSVQWSHALAHKHRVLPHTEMLSLSGERNTVTHFWQSGEQGTNTIMQFKFSSWMHAKPEGSWNGAPGSYSLVKTHIKKIPYSSAALKCHLTSSSEMVNRLLLIVSLNLS